MRIPTVLVALALMAHPAIAESFRAPDGSILSVAKCKSSSTDCLRQASRSCDGPYQVLDSESHAGGLFADAIPGPVTWYSMAYRCGPSDGAMPAFQFRGPTYRPPSYAQCTVYGASIFCFGS